jgi:hypothetical protein
MLPLLGFEVSIKEALGVLAIILAVLNYLPYLFGSLTGRKQPHIFTWSLWLILTSVAFLAQLQSGGGIGAWATGTTAVIIFLITLSALRSGVKDIRLFDWLSLAGALASIPLWLITSDPFWSVILVSIIHSICFLPTFRKGYTNPKSQSSTAFLLTIGKYGCAIAALGSYSVETVLFPATIMTTSSLFVALLYLRR